MGIKKGELNGKCNRTACDNARSEYFNHSTQKYYCRGCAMLINLHNKKDAIEMYGHDLCTLDVTLTSNLKKT
jgi:late competence protein required for DNA uptake (superfamily II DNA/RNA helicase)